MCNSPYSIESSHFPPSLPFMPLHLVCPTRASNLSLMLSIEKSAYFTYNFLLCYKFFIFLLLFIHELCNKRIEEWSIIVVITKWWYGESAWFFFFVSPIFFFSLFLSLFDTWTICLKIKWKWELRMPWKWIDKKKWIVSEEGFRM